MFAEEPIRKTRLEIITRSINHADLGKNEQILYQAALWEGWPVLLQETRTSGFGRLQKTP
jgi:hypothetical protein